MNPLFFRSQIMVYSKGCHTVYSHRYHVVWTTKYRYDVLRGELRRRVREIIRQVCSELGIERLCEKSGFDFNRSLKRAR